MDDSSEHSLKDVEGENYSACFFEIINLCLFVYAHFANNFVLMHPKKPKISIVYS